VNDLIQSIRDTLVNTPDSVCLERARLVTEAYQIHAGAPAPLLSAKAFAHVLAHMTLDLGTNPIFAGNTSSRPRAWMLLPEYGFRVPAQAVVENPAFDGFLDGDAVPDDLRAFWKERALGVAAGIGHLVPDHEILLEGGLNGIIEAAESLQANDSDPEARAFREGCIVACRAVIHWAGRYAEAARGAADQTDDGRRKRALLRVAEACTWVPANPARDLFEALQTVVLAHLAIHIEGHGYSVSLGRPDQYLLPYYEKEDAHADVPFFLAGFLLKLSANSLWGSHSKTQCVTLGGVDPDGRDQCNDLTLAFLDAFETIRMPDPHVFVRWHENIDDRVKTRALEMLAADLGMPMLIGDDQTARGLADAGVQPADAWNYCVVGCNELGVPAKLIYDTLSINDVALLRDTLLGIPQPDRIGDMGELMGVLSGTLRDAIRARVSGRRKHRGRIAERLPTPFTSALMDGCLGRGRDMHRALTYDLPTMTERGFTNLVNALAAIERVVFLDRAAPLSQVCHAIENNFQEHAELRAQLLAAPKWGNDDERADKWARAWLNLREQVRKDVEAETGEKPHLCAHVVRSLHHVEGRRLGATPDARLDGEPLADSVGPQTGTALAGPTAALNSVIQLEPATYWRGGYNLNLTLPGPMMARPELREKIKAMADAFFADGGQELQLGCLDSATLKDARAHPEKHRDLIVRVAGFNALFVKLSPVEQDELIRRVEATECK